MARTTKGRFWGVRVDEHEFADAENYTEITKVSLGDLVRVAVKEYINNHPPKSPVKPALEHMKPGKE